jgi:hypothetical protein
MGPDQIQALLAPYLQAGPTTGTPSQIGSQFGGLGQLGMQLLANSGPSPVRMRFGQVLGNSMLQAQASNLAQAKARQELASNAIALQNQQAMLAMLANPNAAGQGTGLPIDTTDNGSGSSGNATQTPNGTTVAPSGSPQAAGALPPSAQLRLNALGASSAAPPGAPVSAAPPGANAAIPGLPGAPYSPSAAPPGAPPPRQIMPPGGSGQLPPGFNAFQGSSARAPSWLTPPTAAQISNVPVGGFSPQMAQRLALLRGGDPVTTASKLREQQLQIAQQRYAPAIAQLDTLTQSDTPSKYVAANPQLAAAWQKLAPQLGMDPQKDFNDQNVRTAFTFGRNQLAGALSEATVAPNVMLQNRSIGNGGTIQIDPRTGKVTQGAPQQETAPFVMPDGSVKLLTKTDGMSRGLSPFSAETYINPGTVAPTATAIAAYKAAPLTAQAIRTAQGQAIMAQVYQLNPKYDATQYATKQKAREDFATGSQGDTVRSLSTATDHLNQLGVAATAMQSNDTQVFNRVRNYFSQETGGSKVTNFDSMKEIVGDEVVKAVVGSTGGVGDRDAIKDAFAAASSPAQLQGVIAKYKGLMGGQLSSLRRQYQQSTGLNDFNDMVSPAAGKQLGGSNTGSLNIGQSTNLNGFTVTRTN